MQAALTGFSNEVFKLLKIKESDNTDHVTIFPDREGQALCRVDREIVTLLGAKVCRIMVIGYTGRGRQCKLLMGKRLATAVINPTKFQTTLSMDSDKMVQTREELSEVAYRVIGLQPDCFNRLKSATLQNVMEKYLNGIRRMSIHVYDLDLTDLPIPKGCQHIERFEMVPVHNVLDWCHAGLVCDHDIPGIVGFCIRHGIITPETDENYALLNHALNYNIGKAFPYKK